MKKLKNTWDRGYKYREQVYKPVANMIVNLSQQHSLVSNWVSELRDTQIQTDRMRFRRNLERIGEIAVSYTHLDVYKRQPYRLPSAGGHSFDQHFCFI